MLCLPEDHFPSPCTYHHCRHPSFIRSLILLGGSSFHLFRKENPMTSAWSQRMELGKPRLLGSHPPCQERVRTRRMAHKIRRAWEEKALFLIRCYCVPRNGCSTLSMTEGISHTARMAESRGRKHLDPWKCQSTLWLNQPWNLHASCYTR